MRDKTPRKSGQAQAHSQTLVQHFLRRLYRALPLPVAARKPLKTLAFTLCPGLFRNSEAYAYWQLGRKARKSSFPYPRASSPSRKDWPQIRETGFPATDDPEISILIPVYGKLPYTLHCLRSIQRAGIAMRYEVIVIDDSSPDGSAGQLAEIRNLRLIRNSTNIGYLRSCNLAAAAARGRYLLFLNNDTEVQPGWAEALHATFTEFPDTGLAGSKLLFADGRLQEAGGIIWSDANGCNYGRDADPNQPEYNFVREADYCSAASIMIPNDLFHRIGGYDERFAPAYYEDTDLAFMVRKAGLKVRYQPASQVFHFEGISSGTDIDSGIKSFQKKNRPEFLKKWQTELADHGNSDDPIRANAERGVQRSVLIMDWSTPRPDQDSGSIDTINFIRIFQQLGFKVVFIPCDLLHLGEYTAALQGSGVECHYQPFTPSLEAHLRASGDRYDLVMLQRAHYAAPHIASVRRHCPGARILFNTVDLHFLRERRQAELESSAELLARADQTREIEFSVMQRSDMTLVISEQERRTLAAELPDIGIASMPFIREVSGSARPFSARGDIFFIGGFRHEPNIDAVRYLLTEIWPLVHARLPELRCYIIGGNMPQEISKLCSAPGIIAPGYLRDLGPVLDECRLSVAPLRFGAGIKGKIATSLTHGVPCIATALAAEGMGLQDRENVMLADSPEEFAAALVEAYRDEALWNRLSAGGLEHFEREYSLARGQQRFAAIIEQTLSQTTATELQPAIATPESA